MERYETIALDKEPDKIFGGVLTLTQGIIVGGGFFSGVVIGSLFWIGLKIPILGVMLAMLPIGASLYLALYKKHGMSVMQFRRVKNRYKAIPSSLMNCRPDKMKTVVDYTGNSFNDIYQEDTNGRYIKRSVAQKEEARKIATGEIKKKKGIFEMDNNSDEEEEN